MSIVLIQAVGLRWEDAWYLTRHKSRVERIFSVEDLIRNQKLVVAVRGLFFRSTIPNKFIISSDSRHFVINLCYHSPKYCLASSRCGALKAKRMSLVPGFQYITNNNTEEEVKLDLRERQASKQ